MRRLRAMWATLFAVAALGGCASVVPAARPTLAQAQAVPAAKVTPVAMPTCFTAYCRRNAIPVRWQWMNNAGYCGETALIAAGLYYGQYTSQYVARQLASGAQWSTNPNGYYQLLLGDNAMKAATAMHLTSVPFTYAYAGGSGTDVLPTPQFLVWVKQQVLRGNPVIAGVYENAVVLGSAKPDGQYDHIVSVIGVGSNHPLSANGTTYRPDDYLIFSDNGLYGPNPPNTLPYSQLPPFYYPNTWNGGGGYPDVDTYANYAFGAFQKTRKHASASQSSYSLPVNSKANGYPGNFGLAVTGVMDYSHETLPVSLTVSPVLEYPYVSEGSASNPSPTAPPAMPIALTVKVSGLVAGAKYELYEYDGTPSEPFARVPNGQFNALAAVATNSWSFTATRASFTISPTPKPGGSYASNDSVAFRAVPASGP